MAAEFSAEEILAVTGGRLAQGLMPDSVGRICTDTRLSLDGAWFLALNGKNYDGHDFLGDAYSGGAIGAIVNERQGYAIAGSSFPLIVVQDTLAAYHKLARNWRRRLNPKVVAVTASRGETSFATELCKLILGQAMVVCSETSEQSSRGSVQSVLHAILDMDDDTQCLVVQIAPDRADETQPLAEALMPSLVILRVEGFGHLRLTETEQKIADAECSLITNLNQTGACVVGARSPSLRLRTQKEFPQKSSYFFEARQVQVVDHGQTFGIHVWNRELEFVVPKVDRFDLCDAWCAIVACQTLGVSTEQIASALHTLSRGILRP